MDNSRVETLRNPEKHSVHCLVDVGACISSGYEVLMEPKEEGGLYSRAFRLDRAGNDMILDTARAVGICSTCTGEGTLRNGFRATINGTIVEASTDSVPAIVAVTQLLDSPADCPNGTMTMPISNITEAGIVKNSTMKTPIDDNTEAEDLPNTTKIDEGTMQKSSSALVSFINLPLSFVSLLGSIYCLF